MEKFSGITNIYQQGSPWLIFLHGFPDDSSVWSLQVEKLSANYNVWCPDLFSHSYSDQIKGIADFIRNIKSDELVYLIGHDMGGPVACEVSDVVPGRVTKIFLINTLSLGQFLSRWKNPRQLVKSFYMPFFIGPLHNTKWWKNFSSQFLKLAYDKGGIAQNDSLRNHSTATIAGIKRYREAMLTIPSHVLGNKIQKTETHFMFGSKDDFLIVPDENELNKHYREYSIEVIPSNHWPMRTHGKEITEWIQRKIANG